MIERTEQEVMDKIVHILSIYPVISPTMLQAALGPSTRPSLWRPILATLIESGKVFEENESLETPTSRYNTYTKLSLKGTRVLFQGESV